MKVIGDLGNRSAAERSQIEKWGVGSGGGKVVLSRERHPFLKKKNLS